MAISYTYIMKMVKLEESVHRELQSVGVYGETMSDIVAKCVRAFKEKQRRAA